MDRAQAIEDFADAIVRNDRIGPVSVERTMREWATEHRLAHTRLAGGEYHGAFVVNGTEGIKPKE